jgi:hypothetical protein
MTDVRFFFDPGVFVAFLGVAAAPPTVAVVSSLKETAARSSSASAL